MKGDQSEKARWAGGRACFGIGWAGVGRVGR